MDSRKELFDQIVSYIDKHYKDVSKTQLPAIFHYHRNFFYELFKEQAGMTYVQYLQKVRLEKAMELLADPSKSVQTICEETGYKNITWFYKLFHERYGLTPKQYREKHQN